MAEYSRIGWTDHTFNPWTGCTKVGPGCDSCYAESWAKRSGIVQWGPDAARRRTSGQTWAKPLKWNAEHAQFEREHGRRQRVFCASLSDVFDNQALPQWRHDLFDVIVHTPYLDWLLLTKRVGNVKAMVPEAWMRGAWPRHVWLGATIVNREEMLRDGPKLAELPAPVRFWSCEPLLGDLGRVPAMLLPSWIIAGGESGPKCRPCSVDWLGALKDEAVAGAVPLFMKQLGGHPDKRELLEDFPEDLRIRQWPKS
jgi:protein gp37